MNDEPHDPLIEAALTATEGGDVDWEQLYRELPRERGTLEALAELATVAAAHRADPEEDPADAGEPVHFRWGPLDIRRRMGSGSFGEVYAAWDPRLQREVALKLRRAGNAEGSRRWLEEARRLARVRHPNVVMVHGADLHDGRAGMWMETVRGGTLEDRLRLQGPVGAREAALIGAELCGALAAVHAAGLVHGDVKTHNIMREGAPGHARDAGRIVLMDFGSARESSSADPLAPGTPLFTAPEVLAGGRGTVASDLWSLGVVLYRLVTGSWPVDAKSLDELREKLGRDGPMPLRTVRPDLPHGFVAAVGRALERDPAKRWRDAAELERELLTSLGTDRASATEVHLRHAQRRRLWRLAATAGTVIVIAAAAWLWVTHGRKAWHAWQSRTPAFVATLVDEMAGGAPNVYLGAWLYRVGDVTGDGQDDVVVSAPGAGEHGETYLMSVHEHTLERVLTLHGEEYSEFFGGMALAPDIDGDGRRDLVVAAAINDHGGRDAGRVYVYLSTPRLDSIPDLRIDGTEPGQYFGWGISAGDINGDGHDDLLVGAHYDSRAGVKSGRMWAFFGGPGFDATPDFECSAGTPESEFGGTVAFLGDVNGDNEGDFAVSAWTYGGNYRGAAFIYYGGRVLDDRPDLTLKGPIEGGVFGIVRQGTGDINGDGYADILVASEGGNGLEPRSGTVTVFYGGPDIDAVPDVRLEGDQRGSGFGASVNAGSDVDGDGQVDLIVGAPWYDTKEGQMCGRLYVFHGGRDFDAVPEITLTGPPTAIFGWLHCVVPDPDGGVADLLVNLRNLSRPFPAAGIIQRFDLERWIVRGARRGDRWAPGGNATLRWSGATRADVALSADGGKSWQTVARNVGGKPVNETAVTVPGNAKNGVRVRLATAGSGRNAVVKDFDLAP